MSQRVSHTLTPPAYPTRGVPCTLTDQRPIQQSVLIAAFDASAADTQTTAELQSEMLLRNGFHPLSDGRLERKNCPACNICIPVRIPLELFSENTEHKRIRKRNAHLLVDFFEGLPDIKTGGSLNQTIQLFTRYTASRFPDLLTKAFNPIERIEGYRSIAGYRTHHIRVHHPQTQLTLGYLIYHTAGQSAYGTMFFYEPAMRSQSIGHFLVLQTLEKLKTQGIRHLYLGHWTSRASAYSWKDKYEPLEFLMRGPSGKIEWSAPLDHGAVRALRAHETGAYPQKRKLTL